MQAKQWLLLSSYFVRDEEAGYLSRSRDIIERESTQKIMAGSKKKENGTSSISKKQVTSSARRSREKRKRLSSPEIDRYIQMKWGLALLGEEKAKAYLAWIQARLDADVQ